MKKSKDEFYETYRKLRRSWGEIRPITKVIPNKKRPSRKRKYKGDEEDA